ncbi:hypothetical protein HIM_02709 [Hirsutella minnesotensis 3608]|nr:hypothetical protein HIM_02709 [Hirsutella minnesotensis 3608]
MVSALGGILIAALSLSVAGAIGWIAFSHLRARKLGLPAPTLSSYIPGRNTDESYGAPRPASGGVVGWFNDQVRKVKNRGNRSAAGAYEQTQGGAARPREPL